MKATAPSASKIAALQSPSTPHLHVVRPLTDVIASFPATRYYGSKRRLLSWLYNHLKNIEFETALDAFGGTASVSLLLKAMRKDVSYHDGFLFNEDVGRVLLANNLAIDRREVLEICNSVAPRDGVIAQNFAGLYYLNEENRWIDGFIAKVGEAKRSAEERSLLRYLLYQACLKKRPFNLFHRANLHLRTKPAVTRSFGNAVTWEKPFIEHIGKAYDELVKSATIATAPQQRISILPHGDATSIKPGYDLVYLDPPYLSRITSRNRDNYWKRYHFLEGLADYENWESKIEARSPLRMMPEPEWFSDWTYAATFKERLFGLLRQHRSSTVVLSYVTGAIPTFDEIKNEFTGIFREVSIHSIEHNHALSGNKKRELLFVGRPR